VPAAGGQGANALLKPSLESKGPKMSAWTGWRTRFLGGLTALASLVFLTAAATATATATAALSTVPAGAAVTPVASSSIGPSFTLSGALSGTLHDGPNAGCP
jgi:hypothetical protein